MAGAADPRYDKKRRLLGLFQQKEKDGKTVSLAHVCATTGWKPSTAKTYLAKTSFNGVLTKQSDGSYRVNGATRLTESQFTRFTSQSETRRAFGFQFSPLVRQLLQRASTNAVLAIESFNRPSLENRLDAFVLLFITAWEQLLKAEIEHQAPGSIFTGEKTRMGRDKTIGFQTCLERTMQPGDIVWRNLELIRSLRDDAAHLLVSELQPIATRYFQAGLCNLNDRYAGFCGENPISQTGAGLLTLALPYSKPDMLALRKRYGQASADEIGALVESLENEATTANDNRFAIEIKYRLVLTDEPGASTIHLAKSCNSDATSGLIIEKVVDAEKRYPYFLGELTEEIDRRTNQNFTTYDIRAFVHCEKTKTADNEHHHHFKKTNRHAYSAAFVDLVVKKLQEQPDYQEQARTSYSHFIKTRQKQAAHGLLKSTDARGGGRQQ